MTYLSFNNLVYGHTYTATLMNEDYNENYSNIVELKGLKLTSTTGNYPPKIVTYPTEPFTFQEGQTNEYVLTATDLEGDNITYSLLENLPKGMIFKEDSVIWTPVVGDVGLHKFTLVLSDGVNRDTIPLEFDVRALGTQTLSMGFSSQKLYEGDNMMINVSDENSTSDEIEVKLANYNTEEQITTKGISVGKGKYIVDFNLSAITSSDLTVSDGDTIVVVYETGQEAYFDVAFFSAKPQITDNIVPTTITDLAVKEVDSDSLVISFTVPTDAMDNGNTSKPWVYDLRYNHSDIQSEVEYVSSFSIIVNEIAEIGTTQEVKIAKSTLENFDLNAQT